VEWGCSKIGVRIGKLHEERGTGRVGEEEEKGSIKSRDGGIAGEQEEWVKWGE
jgi:hypothetical protein